MSQVENSISGKIIRNTIFNAIGRFWGIIVALFLTPYIIGHIGIDRFGIWAIVGVLTGYLSLLDLGIGTAFVKFVSEHYTKKDYKSINQIVNTGIVFYTVFAVVIITIGFSIISTLLNFFNIPQELYKEAVFVFLLGIIVFGFSNTLSIFGAIQGGLQRMDLSNKIAIFMSFPNIAGTIFFLENDYGLPGLMVNNAIIFFITSMTNIIIAFKILPELRFNPFLFSREMLRKMFGFGIKMQVTKTTMIINANIDKALISIFLNLSLVGFYELGQRVVQKGRDTSLLLVSAILPAVSELDARNDKDGIYKLYLRGSKYLSIVAMPLMVFISITAPTIMLAWMGSKYEISVLIIRILIIAHFINLMTGVATGIATGIGRPGMITKAALINMALNLFLSIGLMLMFGFWGVVIGTSVSLVLGSCIFMHDFHKYVRIPIYSFIKSAMLKPIIACLLSGITISLLGAIFSAYSLHSGRLVNFSILIVQAMIFAIIYLAIIYKIQYLDTYDKDLLITSLSKVFKKMEGMLPSFFRNKD